MSTHRPHIPTWKTVKLGEVTEIIKGGTPSRNVGKYFRGNIAWAIPSDITALDSFLYIDDTETHITEEALSNSAARLLPAGTVLLTSRATIGETAITTVPMATNQGFANFICHETLLNVFLAYYLRYIKEKLNDLAGGSTFKEITKGTLLNIEIPLPPLSQQRAIAEALSDVDGLLNALEALIAKKRAIKKATMQQLLTGKTRLPGFSGVWEMKRLGEIGTFTKGRGIKRDDISAEGLPCIRYGELYTRYQDYILKVASRIPPDVAATALPIQKGDLLFAGSGETAEEIGRCAAYLGEEQAYAGGDVIVLTPSGQNSIYLGHLMNHSIVSSQKARMGQGDAVVHIYINNLAQVQIELPSVKEQNAIASVLSDMDAEITALRKRRDKTHAIKQGMMQQLLTGRVRLSESRICPDDTD